VQVWLHLGGICCIVLSALQQLFQLAAADMVWAAMIAAVGTEYPPACMSADHMFPFTLGTCGGPNRVACKRLVTTLKAFIPELHQELRTVMHVV
jgi:hypothetical protein